MLNLEQLMERYRIKPVILYREAVNGFNHRCERIGIFEFNDWRDIERLVLCADYPFKRGAQVLKKMLGDIDQVGLYHTCAVDHVFGRTPSPAPVTFSIPRFLGNSEYLARTYINVEDMLRSVTTDNGSQNGQRSLILDQELSSDLDYLGDWTIRITDGDYLFVDLSPYRRIDDHDLTLFRLRWGHLLLAPMESSSYAAV